LRFVLIFLASYGVLSWLYAASPLREAYTDLLLATAGKLSAVTATDELRVFFHIPNDGSVAYDTVFAMVADQSEIDAYNAAVVSGEREKPEVKLRRFVIATHPLDFFPMSIALALPVPWKRKLRTIPLALLVTFAYVVLKWFCHIHFQAAQEADIPLRYFGYDATALFDLLHRIMNRHFGFTFMVCILIALLASFRPGDGARLRASGITIGRR